MSRKLYFEAIRALPEKWIDERTMITVGRLRTAFAAHPDYKPMEYVNDEWRDIEVSALQAEDEAEKTLRFLKTGRQHD
ncbi:hypothetical protein KAR91_34350 [Candidatus Pacearchaeota archaeon]|nr:hypothetical protein [Candidatus Pacearchaeota archaeon]